MLLLKNNLTNICSKKSKIGMNLWMVYTWKALESTQDGKKVNELYIVGRNHKRSVVALDYTILGILKTFSW